MRGIVAVSKLAIVIIALGTSDRAIGQTEKSARTNPALVSEFPCPDPYVFHDGADWYIFGTGASPFFLQGKEFGEGKMKKVFLDLDYAGFSVPVAHIWGFIVHHASDGTYHGYGTLHLGHFHTVIASFEPGEGETWEPGKPITRWKFQSLLVGDPAQQDWNYYETKILQDTDKSIYLMFVARSGRDNFIFAQRMKSWTEIDHSAPRRLMLKPDGLRSEDRNGPGGMQIVEGGSIFRYKGRYVLLYSVGDYLLPNYKLGMAFSDSLIPPPGQTYVKIPLPDQGGIWRNPNSKVEIGYLLQSEKPQWPNYSGNLVVGPGLGSIVIVDKKPWLFFHGYKPEDTERRPENRFVFRVTLKLGVDKGAPNMGWLRANLPVTRSPAALKKQERARMVKSLGKLLRLNTVWEGTSDWGGGRTTKSELRYVKGSGGVSVWEFAFLEPTIFKTPVPFREFWAGEITRIDEAGAILHLTRHDGKAWHEYRLTESGDLNGKAIGSPFSYRFTVRQTPR